ncbi:RDD family protein [Cellulomonas soli]|uniref:RDD family protein n=1 Tax=Cellulomonas soli TaxID=931535 RepID=UPI003F83A48A
MAPTAVAPVGLRVLAYLVDSVVLGLVVGLGWGIVALLGPQDPTGSAITLLPSVLALLAVVGQLVAEATTGATAGSALLGIRTLSARTGRPAGLLAVLVRALVVGAGALVCFVGQWVVVASGAWDRGPALRGWHDKASGTMVLRARAAGASAPAAPGSSQRHGPGAPPVPRGVTSSPTGTAAPAPMAPAGPVTPVASVPVLTFPGPTARVEPSVAPAAPTVGPPPPSAPPPAGTPAAGAPVGAPPVAEVPFVGPVAPAQPPLQPVAPAPVEPGSSRRARRAATGQTPMVDVPWAVALPTVTGAQPTVTGAQPVVTGAQPVVTGAQPVVTGPQSALTPTGIEPVVSTAAQPIVAGPPPVAAPRAAAASAADPFAELELTRLREAPGPTGGPTPGIGLRLVLDTGERVEVAGDGLIGRRPDPAPGVVHLVPVDDPARSVSKVHLAFGLDAGAPGQMWVMDRGSTNGSVVVTPSGAESVLPAGARVSVGPGWTVRFGERRLRVEQA